MTNTTYQVTHSSNCDCGTSNKNLCGYCAYGACGGGIKNDQTR